MPLTREINISVVSGVWNSLMSSDMPDLNVVPNIQAPKMSANDVLHFACKNAALGALKKGLLLLKDAVDRLEAGANPQKIEADVLEAARHVDFAFQLSEAGGRMQSKEMARFHIGRGFSELVLSRIDSKRPMKQAVSDFERATKLDPARPLYRIILALAYWTLDRQKDAIASCEDAINIDPAYALAYYLKGLYHQERGETDLAHDDIYWAVTLDPDLYEEKFEPIMQAEREAEAYWDDMERRPEFEAMLRKREAKI